MATPLWAIAVIIFATLIGAFGALMLKKGSAKFNLNIFQQLKNWQLILGCSLYVLASAITIPTFRYGELSVLFPFVSLSYIWVSLLSIKHLGERMNAMKWLGIVAIIVGVALIGLGSG